LFGFSLCPLLLLLSLNFQFCHLQLELPFLSPFLCGQALHRDTAPWSGRGHNCSGNTIHR
ncbi:hypothetical protein NDU88_008237, partial [Pleurodeles waltl]